MHGYDLKIEYDIKRCTSECINIIESSRVLIIVIQVEYVNIKRSNIHERKIQ